MEASAESQFSSDINPLHLNEEIEVTVGIHENTSMAEGDLRVLDHRVIPEEASDAGSDSDFSDDSPDELRVDLWDGGAWGKTITPDALLEDKVDDNTPSLDDAKPFRPADTPKTTSDILESLLMGKDRLYPDIRTALEKIQQVTEPLGWKVSLPNGKSAHYYRSIRCECHGMSLSNLCLLMWVRNL